MEENEVISKEKNGSYLLGIIGAILGGLIGSIPWILVYIYGNLIVALLSSLIALGALKGYTLFKGKISKSLKPIIIVITLLIVVFINLVVVPNYISATKDIDLNYIYSELKSQLLHDLILSILFALLGIGAVISNINKTLIKNNVVEDKENIIAKTDELNKAQIDMQLNSKDKLDLDMVRKIFSELNATSKKTAVEKEIIIQKFQCENPEKLFKKYKSIELIKKYKGKYYYNSKNEQLLTKSYWIWLVIFVAVIVFANSFNSDDSIDDAKNLLNQTQYELDQLQSTLDNAIYNFGNNSLAIIPATNWIADKKAIPDLEGIFIKAEDENASLSIYYYNQDDFIDSVSLEVLKDTMVTYSKEQYALSEEPLIEEFALSQSKGYKLSFNTTYNGYKVTVNNYIFNIENYLIEATAISIKSKADIYLNDCEKMINSIYSLDAKNAN